MNVQCAQEHVKRWTDLASLEKVVYIIVAIIVSIIKLYNTTDATITAFL